MARGSGRRQREAQEFNLSDEFFPALGSQPAGRKKNGAWGTPDAESRVAQDEDDTTQTVSADADGDVFEDALESANGQQEKIAEKTDSSGDNVTPMPSAAADDVEKTADNKSACGHISSATPDEEGKEEASANGYADADLQAAEINTAEEIGAHSSPERGETENPEGDTMDICVEDVDGATDEEMKSARSAASPSSPLSCPSPSGTPTVVEVVGSIEGACDDDGESSDEEMGENDDDGNEKQSNGVVGAGIPHKAMEDDSDDEGVLEVERPSSRIAARTASTENEVETADSAKVAEALDTEADGTDDVAIEAEDVIDVHVDETLIHGFDDSSVGDILDAQMQKEHESSSAAEAEANLEALRDDDILREGDGSSVAVVSSATGGDDDDDDEFSYALDDNARRDVPNYTKHYNPDPMPAHLATGQNNSTHAIQEEEEEEEEERPQADEGQVSQAANTEDAITEAKAVDDTATDLDAVDDDEAARKEWAEVEARQNHESTESPTSDDADVDDGGRAAVIVADVDEDRKEIELVVNEASKESAAQLKLGDRPVETSTASSVSYSGVESSLFAMAKSDVDLDALVVEEAPSGCTNTLFACLGMGTPALDADLHEERRLFFGTSKLAMIDSEPSHFGLLLRIHEALVKPEQGLSSVSRYGKHWEEIGFQGSDPATDLRGTGMLSLLQMCYFVEDNPATLAQVWEVAKDKESGFPFAVVAINITRWTMDCIRGGKLNGIMNKEESVVKVANRFFSQAFVGFAEGYATHTRAALHAR